MNKITRVHTQNIERVWRDLKQRKKMEYGIRKSEIEGYCAEFCWRRWARSNREDIFTAALELIAGTDWELVSRRFHLETF